MPFYLKLKDCGTNRHVYYEYLDESHLPAGGLYMSTGKWKYAEEFETKESAQNFKNEWDKNDHFEIVTELN